MKKSRLFTALMCTSLLWCALSNPKAYSELRADFSKTVGETIDLNYCISKTVGNKMVANTRTLLNLDGSEDYIFVEFQSKGYAVFYKESMEMLEYSPAKNITLDNETVYYSGPGGFFLKKNDTFKNILNNTTFRIDESSLLKRAKVVRKAFSNHKTTIKNGCSKTSSGNKVPGINTDNPILSNYGTRIPHSAYFTINPKHGINSSGTCAAIAAEMLLTYHNYYSDRRIIPNNYLNGDSQLNKEDNPNHCSDPIRMTHETLGARGSAEIDNNDSNNYFAKLVKKIPANAAYFGVTSGLKSILKERKDALGNSFNYTVEDKYGGWFFGSLKVDTTRVKNEINEGRPSIVLMQESLGATDHYVVAYGYSEYTYPTTNETYDGFITNFGWEDEDVNVWINSSWICAYITMTINHEHDYIVQRRISGTNRTCYICNICGHRTDAVILEADYKAERCIELFANMPLNKNLYTRFNDDNYEIKREYYKYYHFKTPRAGIRTIQTFCNQSTTISILDTDEKTVLSSSSGGGYYNNAFVSYAFEANKVYYVKLNLTPLQSDADIKIVVVPTNYLYSRYSNITHLSGENAMASFWLNTNCVSMLTFSPTVEGAYILTTDGTKDCVLYFFKPLDGVNECLFDDDSAGNFQARITTGNLGTSTTYFIVVSPYQLYAPGEETGISLHINRIT